MTAPTRPCSHLTTDGHHWLVDYRGCDPDLLRDIDAMRALLVGAVEAAGATPLERAFHRFDPDGVSGVVLLEESHITIHTWPRDAYAAVDFYTCGDTHPERAHAHLLAGLRAADCQCVIVARGAQPRPGAGRSMTVTSGSAPEDPA